ncbi:amidase [Comamonas serinivorans]|uniref:Amidase n=1 Tax=Comamonas serinivorans TaxID=1082851 RepID=A0A1Y0EJ17_9BURK|nr:amidase [Comamonas serinivorans]ARU03587.1 amidase [Comamonas serinivorans]
MTTLAEPAAAPAIPATDVDLMRLTLAQVQQGFASGAFTSEDLTRASLRQIERYNAHYKALLFLNDSALADAQAIDRRRAAGEPLGPLAGVPMVVKDPMDMVGFPTTAGWRLLYSQTGGVDLFPQRDAPVVARMRAAGAVILGKTNVPVLSHSGTHCNDSWAGPCLNPVMPDRMPGASSSGTACAVATGMAVFGLAEETGGSIQNPASAQDLVGIKPTIGLVPNAGVLPLSGNRDVVGPIARCVRDAALCLDALAGYSAEDPKTLAGVGKLPEGGYTARMRVDALRGKRIGLYGLGWRNQPLSDEATALYARAQDELRALGATLVDDPFAGSGFAELRQPTPPLANFDARGLESLPWDLQQYLTRLGPQAAIQTVEAFARATASEDPYGPQGVLGFMPNLPAFVAAAADPHTPPDLSAFIALKARYLTLFEQVMQAQGLDALVMPQMREELPLRTGPGTIQETTVGEINIAGLPGVTVPAGRYASGSPFGLIFVGRQWSEADLIAYAFAYESATQHRAVPTLAAV